MLIPSLDSLILEAPIDVQASLLSYVGQQAIAHAATIFATLTAAFAFAAVQKKLGGSRTTFFVLILSILLAGAIYAGLRLYYYGLLSGVVLGLPATPSNQTLDQYWRDAYSILGTKGGPSTIFYVHLGLGQTIQSIAFSFVLGFAWATGIASYSIGDQGWWHTFALLPRWLKSCFYFAWFDYLFEITLVRLVPLLFVLVNFDLPKEIVLADSLVASTDSLLVLLAIVLSILIVAKLYDRLDRLMGRIVLWSWQRLTELGMKRR